MNRDYQRVSSSGDHPGPYPAYQGSPDQSQELADFSYQAPPNEENVRSSVQVTQHSSTSIFRPGYSESAKIVSKPRTGNRRKRWVFHLISHLVTALWLAPIASLLYLNFNRHIIGASVWCPHNNCSAGVFDEDPNNYIQRANQLDREDHNALGALQFVAKGLEIWFMLVASALIYDVAMVFARRGGGLPLGYMLTHLEFGDIRNLFNWSMWTSPIPHADSASARQRSRTMTLYLFAVLAAFLTLLANLMGPATAVLVLPTLQWIDTPRQPDQIFNGTGAAAIPSEDPLSFPGGNISFPGCNKENLALGMYSCNAATFAPSLDAWATSAAANARQDSQFHNDINLAVSQEASFDFTLNVSSELVVWVPNRQVLVRLSRDWDNLYNDVVYGDAVYGDATSTIRYNDSLTTVLQRTGPTIGVNMTIDNRGNWTVYELGENKLIECFGGWTVDYETFYTKCIQLGTDWHTVNDWSNFTLTNPIPGQNNITVYSMYSEKSVYFNDADDFGSGISSCLGPNVTNCDWDTIFDNDPPQDLPQNLRDTSKNVGITVYSSHGPNNDVVWCEQVAYLSFATYQFDLTLSSASLELYLVQLNNIDKAPLDHPPLHVSPRWLLAAWSVDVGGTVNGSRAMVQGLARLMPSLLTTPATPTDNYTEDRWEFNYLHMYAIGQAMSMVNYYFVDTTEADPSVHPDTDHPVLYRFGTLRVWAYGLSGRTSRLGVAVVLAGSFCALLRLLLGFSVVRHQHSPVELFMAALEHQHQHEFNGLHREKDWAKVRYRMEMGHDGRPTFHPDRVS
ncbi:hypothetical protein MMC07_002060 [Pseudocyphellaria aurata]|nr:hypothetical protein [Pseudocyphellaria aurata]